jgi:ubiquinone/menaquinone biosynthesis C-methylase UbiE
MVTYYNYRSTEFDMELARIETEYQRRTSDEKYSGLYSSFNEGALLLAQSVERNLLAMLKRHSFSNLAGQKILDVGCGSGQWLQRFINYGACPENLYGIDLFAQHIERAQCLYPTINWNVGSAHELPYPDTTFDLVTSFVMFSSILDTRLRRKIADEMWRVRKPSGLILFYDFTYSNPWNPAVRGITRQEIRQCFRRPETLFDFKRITLAPPIARRVAPHAYWLAFTLEQLGIFNTHIICMIHEK